MSMTLCIHRLQWLVSSSSMLSSCSSCMVEKYSLYSTAHILTPKNISNKNFYDRCKRKLQKLLVKGRLLKTVQHHLKNFHIVLFYWNFYDTWKKWLFVYQKKNKREFCGIMINNFHFNVMVSEMINPRHT